MLILKKMNKLIKIGGHIFFGLIVLVIMLLLVALGKEKMPGETPSVAGIRMYIVLSGSMSPAFDTGSLVFVRPIKVEKIKDGDIITFKGAGQSEGITSHRVVSANHTAEGLTFTTKGDANEIVDPIPIEAERVVGKIALAVPYLGYLMTFIRTKKGALIFILVPLVSLVLYELIGFYISEKKRKAWLEGRPSNRET